MRPSPIPLTSASTPRSSRRRSRLARAARRPGARQRRALCGRNLASGPSTSGVVHVRQLEPTDRANSAGENRAADGGRRRGNDSLQTDPDVASSWNSYAYASNNSISATDPDGLISRWTASSQVTEDAITYGLDDDGAGRPHDCPEGGGVSPPPDDPPPNPGSSLNVIDEGGWFEPAGVPKGAPCKGNQTIFAPQFGYYTAGDPNLNACGITQPIAITAQIAENQECICLQTTPYHPPDKSCQYCYADAQLAGDNMVRFHCRYSCNP